MENAVVVGRGMVGNSTMQTLGITKFYSRSDYNVDFDKIHTFKYIFVCVPTPNTVGIQNIDSIRVLIKEINDKQKNKEEKSRIIIRSTVLPGVCERLMAENEGSIICHVPEFLTEATWEKDSEFPDIVVIGADNHEIREEIAGIFRQRYKTIDPDFILTDNKTASTIKYAINCFYALKVLYANQIYDFCDEHDIPYETVKAALYKRKWIGNNHLDIFHNGGRGAGGKCLKKDLEAFSNYSTLPLLEYANKMNKGLLLSYPKKV